MTARRFALALLVVLGAFAAWVGWANFGGEAPLRAQASPPPADATLRERGANLAIAGNCAGCHTARGGEAYAGGRGVETPFGIVYASNLTPDNDTGLGRWSADEFWRALHHGRSRDGRLLYPAFPYPSFTLVTRDDADAMFAFLRSLPAVRRPNTPHALRFPYNLQASLAVWRALFFRPATFEPDATRSAEWNRGRYLVRGLGHCEACHAPRNLFGATGGEVELGGGLIPMQNWYAPSLASSREAGVADWQAGEIVSLLKTGVAPRASVMGPMAEVVFRSTQHLSETDLQAMATFLKSLPQHEAAPWQPPAADGGVLTQGRQLYDEHCAGCHGAQGHGVPGLYPALAGNRAVALPSPNNVIKAILHGGFSPATAGNPRPFGMPPYAQALSDEQIAAVASHLRQSWGHAASAVSTLDVLRAR